PSRLGSATGLPEQTGNDSKVNKSSLLHGAAYTAPFNLTGNPVLSLPCGFNSLGLPLGMQLIGRPLEEDSLLNMGHQYQMATEWHRRKPALN
ncbi:MAG TPA: amidase family protein, partial [Terriglobales bacterium]|nr:amidase family protein [Terriglobales bacterium]